MIKSTFFTQENPAKLVDVFVPVPLHDKTQPTPYLSIGLDPEYPSYDLEHLKKSFSFKELATLLTEYFKHPKLQIGVTVDEANAIVNQSAITLYYMIVHLKLDEKNIGEKAALYCGAPLFYKVNKSTMITENSIVSITPMTRYSTMQSMHLPYTHLKPEKLWPKDAYGQFIVLVNPYNSVYHSDYALNVKAAETHLSNSDVKTMTTTQHRVSSMIRRLESDVKDFPNNGIRYSGLLKRFSDRYRCPNNPPEFTERLKNILDILEEKAILEGHRQALTNLKMQLKIEDEMPPLEEFDELDDEESLTPPFSLNGQS